MLFHLSQHHRPHRQQSLRARSRVFHQHVTDERSYGDTGQLTEILQGGQGICRRIAGDLGFEAGMGVAVVAEEVRSLAKRSAVAARETATIIEDSIHKTQKGAQVSAEVTRHFQEITEKARRVDEIIAQISAASQEQSQGISQLNSAVRSLDSVTQRNAANAEESAAVAVELNGHSDALRRTIGELSGLLSGHADAVMSELSESLAAQPQRQVALARPLPRVAATKSGRSLTMVS